MTIEANGGSAGEAQSGVERIKRASLGLRGTLSAELANEAPNFTEDAKQLLKFHGSYQQDDRDRRRERKRAGEGPAYEFMVRTKQPGGVMTGAQYLALDALASRYGNDTLRITTRQGFQFHGVLKRDVRTAIRTINQALVTTLGACGDVVRNVVTCPAPIGGGLRERAWAAVQRISDELLPQSRAYHEIWLNGERVETGRAGPDPLPGAAVAGERDGAADAEPIYGDRYLPRKFKTGIAFPEDNCIDVHSQDLGFLVVADGGEVAGYDVLVGGGLGQTHGKPDTFPRLATPLGFAPAGDALDVAKAVVLTQRDWGNRVDRRRARLKYLIEERGIEWFRGEVESRLGRRLAPPAGVEVAGVHDHLGWHVQPDGRWFLGVFVENGRIADTDAHRMRTAFREVVRRTSADAHLTTQQNLLFTNVSPTRRSDVDAILADHGVEEASAISPVRRWSMACPAMPTCGLAIAEAERALPEVVTQLERALDRLGLAGESFTVRMTGCPNGCARPYTADIAFVGRALDKYVLYVGGRVHGDRLNTAYADLVPRQALVPTLVPLLERFRDDRAPGERFGDYCDRIGIEALRDAVRGAA